MDFISMSSPNSNNNRVVPAGSNAAKILRDRLKEEEFKRLEKEAPIQGKIVFSVSTQGMNGIVLL